MFDISFSELMLVGVIALIVIGPERLPKVARTVGHLLGRAQRYVTDVKTDIRKEMDAAEISNLKDQMQEAANSVKASVEGAGKAWQAPLDEAQDALKQASESIKTLADSATKIDSDAGTPDTAAQKPAADSDSAPASALSAGSAETDTLPLPDREPEPAVQAATPTAPPNANKGSQ